MSFSSDIKEELSKFNTLADKVNVKCELLGYLFTNNTSFINNGKILRYATESEYTINRFSKLLSNLKIDYQISIEGNTFVIIVKRKEIPFDIQIQEVENKEENKKSMIRGAFLGSGSINNPENGYHLEIGFSEASNRDEIQKILEKFDIHTKQLDMPNKKSIYIKDGEEISKLLALIGASKALLKYEDIRVQKDMRGKVNRLVNCETANLNKTINASIEQIEAIRKLQKENKFNKLDENLKEIALLRLENPDMSLIELGKKLKNPIGKSGVNYRLKKIIEIAQS